MSVRRFVEEGVDVEWLRRQAELEPVRHAFALWDLHEYADRVRFVTLREGPRTLGYLLLWYGSSAYPIIHWVGDHDGGKELAAAFPGRPFVAVVPVPYTALVEELRGPVESHRLRVLEHRRADPIELSATATVRRLTAEDGPALRALASGSTELVTSAYGSADPGRSLIMGAFDSGRLVAVARAQVQLPRVWILGGIYTDPAARGHGYAGAVTAGLTRTAHAAGADAALYVRADNTPAVRAYERVGYRLFEERVWMNAGADIRP